MKLRTRFWILGLLVISSAFCWAETRSFTHYFNELYPAALSVTNSNHTGTIGDFVYTCGGGAEFWKTSDSGNQLAIFLNGTGKQVETTAIQNLDSICIHYYPDAAKDMKVAISSDGGSSYSDVPVENARGVTKVKLPTVGDYCVRMKYKSSYNVYIWKIEYFYIDLSGCPNCFIYTP